jgi:hypothetical protein
VKVLLTRSLNASFPISQPTEATADRGTRAAFHAKDEDENEVELDHKQAEQHSDRQERARTVYLLIATWVWLV